MPFESPLDRRALFAPTLLFAALFLVFVAAAPGRLYGDDVYFVGCIVRERPFAPHFLFLPLARAASRVAAHLGIDPFQTLRGLAALGTAAGGALLFAAARRRGVAGWRAWLFALFPALAPATLFFGTAAEVHGLHFGAVACLVWTLARLAPTSSPWAVLASGLAFGLVLGTHKSGILFLPAFLLAIAAATRGRERRRRAADAGALGLAALGTLVAMLLFHRLETGRAMVSEDGLDWYLDGLRARLSHGYGLDDFAAYLAVDGVAPAFLLAVGGAAGLGAALRRSPRRALVALVALLPHAVFFALFDYPERGAYFVVLLPILAALLLAWCTADGRPERPWHPAACLTLGVAAAGALFAPSELVALLGRQQPLALALAAGLVGLALASRRPVAARFAPAALALCLGAQVVGATRELARYDRERPLLAWARGACAETGGAKAVVIVADFHRYWMLDLLRAPWPEPWRGTWELAREVPLPGPSGFVYGDPGLASADFRRVLAERLAAGVRVYVDASVRAFVAEQPAHADELRHLEERYRLVPVERPGFRAERVFPR